MTILDKPDALPRHRPANRGAKKIRAGNAVLFSQQARDAADALRSRNAYRTAAGLPLIIPGKD